MIRLYAGNQPAVDFNDLRIITQQIDDVGMSRAVVVNRILRLSALLADFHPFFPRQQVLCRRFPFAHDYYARSERWGQSDGNYPGICIP